MIRDLLNMSIRLTYRCAFLGLRAWWFVRRPQSHGAAVAVWHEGKVLLVRTSYRNCYSLPGGFVEKGEPAEQAARRELREELGVDLSLQTLQHAWSQTLNFESRRDTVDIWEVTVQAAPALRVAGREIIWAGWLSPSDALSQRLLPHIAAYLACRRDQGEELGNRDRNSANSNS